MEVKTGPRIVVFRISGTIELSSSINIGKANSYVTIAGQTAPGDGIQIKNWPIAVSYGGHDVVIRYLRMRPGSGGITKENGGDIDGVLIYGPGGKHTYNVVIDHCSVMWAADENADACGAVTNVTYQWCIFAEDLQGEYEKGPHSMGMLISGSQKTMTVSVHHCLFAHNGVRNPALIFVNPQGTPADADHDGMPDAWERERGLNPENGEMMEKKATVIVNHLRHSHDLLNYVKVIRFFITPDLPALFESITSAISV